MFVVANFWSMKTVRISEYSMNVKSTRRAIARECQEMADETQDMVELHHETGPLLIAFAPRSAEYKAWFEENFKEFLNRT